MSIKDNIRADLFRNRIEDKNQLTGTGAIYVGTGVPQYITSDGTVTGSSAGTGTIGPFYETTGIAPTTAGQIPVSVMGETGSTTGMITGLAFKSVNDAMMDYNGGITITPTAGADLVLGKNGRNTRLYAGNDITISASGNTTVSASTGVVTIGNIGSRTSFKSNLVQPSTITGATPPLYQLYQIPEGTCGLDAAGHPYQFQSTEPETKLTSIIYNIGERLDSLGFKEGALQSPDITEGKSAKKTISASGWISDSITSAHALIEYESTSVPIAGTVSVSLAGIEAKDVNASVIIEDGKNFRVTISAKSGILRISSALIVTVSYNVKKVLARLKREGNFVFIDIVDDGYWTSAAVPEWAQKDMTGYSESDSFLISLLTIKNTSGTTTLFSEGLEYNSDNTIYHYKNDYDGSLSFSYKKLSYVYDIRKNEDALIKEEN